MTVKRLLNLRMPPVQGPVPTGEPTMLAAKWVNGVHPETILPPGEGAEIPSVAVVMGVSARGIGNEDVQAVVGDITGDGVDDGVVTRVWNGGGSGSWSDTIAFDASGEHLGTVPVEEQIGSLGHGDLGNSPARDSLRIVDGEVALVAHVYAGSDPDCCPSIEAPLRFRWNGSDFELVGDASRSNEAGSS